MQRMQRKQNENVGRANGQRFDERLSQEWMISGVGSWAQRQDPSQTGMNTSVRHILLKSSQALKRLSPARERRMEEAKLLNRIRMNPFSRRVCVMSGSVAEVRSRATKKMAKEEECGECKRDVRMHTSSRPSSSQSTTHPQAQPSVSCS